MDDNSKCSFCGGAVSEGVLARAHWHTFWDKPDGACPACVQKRLLILLLEKGDAALHSAIQSVWPLDAEAAFGTIPTRLRLHADPRFAGRGVTMGIVDAGFYPHPDLVQPMNRIRAWADATCRPVEALRYTPGRKPEWPGWSAGAPWQWHGLMTSSVAAGNGFMSDGLYSGLAHAAEVVLVQVRESDGRISSASIARALLWLRDHAKEFEIRVVSISVCGDAVSRLRGNAVDEAVGALIEAGVSVVAAAGNDGERRLLPPATAPFAVTVGGIDDKNVFHHAELELWHSNYGAASNGIAKPELVAPSIWVSAPLLPDTDLAREAAGMFIRGTFRDLSWKRRAAELKLVTAHYQHVEGTSFAAPIVGGAIACMLEANPDLTPNLIRDVLMATAQFVSGADQRRQGAGAIDSGRAVARAMAERHGLSVDWESPRVTHGGILFSLHDHQASRVEVVGSWNGWRLPGIAALRIEPGVWHTPFVGLPVGRHSYKFLLDNHRWLDDPNNSRKTPDNLGAFNSVVIVPESCRIPD